MTMLEMPDSTRTADLQAGFPAYLGYVDGDYVTMPGLATKFPRAHLVGLTVTGATLNADGIDCEPGNVNAADTRVWVQRKLAAEPGFRPVVYASVKGQPNYGMGDVLAALSRNGIDRSSVRLLSAHYRWRSAAANSPANMHICGPTTCGEIGVPMDGTQWTDAYPGAGGSVIDMSVLIGNFFGETETERIVRELGIVREGDTGGAVRTVQGCLMARGYELGSSGPRGDGLDGIFGPGTASCVRVIQKNAKIPVDGIVGPLTWPVLLGVA